MRKSSRLILAMALLCFWAADLAAASDEDRWFIVLGSYDRKDLALAQDQAERLEAQGLYVTLADTENYPNFRKGLWALVIGPFSRVIAEDALERLKAQAPDAYLKAGWLPAESNTGTTDPARGGEWFVILGSFPKTNQAAAETRAGGLVEKGLDAFVLDTDDYPNLKNGLWAVALGPFNTTEAAEKMVRRARGLVPDAYIKSGW